MSRPLGTKHAAISPSHWTACAALETVNDSGSLQVDSVAPKVLHDRHASGAVAGDCMGSAFCCSLRALIAVDLIRSMDSRAVVRHSFSGYKPLSYPTPKLLGEY